MGINKALIVDDSRSARLVLKRMLNDLSLDVDTVESATDALDYLESNRPDVIFMDHNMPGMDGFEAVRRIKNNAQTVVIPIMMYTSRGGDVYLSQARALGAVGIIPKTVSPVGLKESLFKLGLVDDRRIETSLVAEDRRIESPLVVDDRRVETTSVDEERRVESALIVDADIHETSDRQLNDNLAIERHEREAFLDELRMLMDDQTVELHNSMWLGVEAVSHEIYHRLNSEREKELEKLQPTLPEKRQSSASAYIVITLFAISIGFNVMLFYDNSKLSKDLDILIHRQTDSPARNTVQQAMAVDSSPAITLQPEPAQANEAAEPGKQEKLKAFIEWAQNRVIEYPFDELALNDRRLPVIEELIDRAHDSGFTGSIILQTHAGIFCTSKDQEGIYTLAADDLPVTQCDNIGNGVQPSDAPSTHQTLSFANYLSEINYQKEYGLVVEVTNVARVTELTKYPDISPEINVGEWNHAAQLNNRITVKLEPDPVNAESQDSIQPAMY
jgi:CheY-like chemotaxis protein